MLSHISKIFIYIFFINKIICYQFDIYPYEAFLPKVVRIECRSYGGRKVCAELYNFTGHPRNPDMLCEPFGHYSYRCFFSRDDYRWIENVYKPYIEKLKTDEDDPLVGSIDYDYKSYASFIRENCNQNCPILDIEETIPIVHIPHDKLPSNFSENLIITNKYGKTIKYQKMKFIDGKEYFVEVPLQKKMFKDDSYLCNERRRESVLYSNNINPCETSVDGIEHTPRSTIPIIYNHHNLNLFNDDVFEICNFDSDCKIIRFTIPFNFNRHSDLYKELYHKYGHLYSERVNEKSNVDIGNYSRQWDDRYRQEYDRQRQELPREDHNGHYSRRCYSTGRCRHINIHITTDCDDKFDPRNCNYKNKDIYKNREEEYQRRIQIGRENIERERERIRMETELSKQRIAQLQEYARRTKLESDRQIERIKQDMEEKQRIHEERNRVIDSDLKRRKYPTREELYPKDNGKSEILSEGCSYKVNVKSC